METCSGTLIEDYQYDANSNRIAALNSSGAVDVSEVVIDGQDRLLQYGDTRFSYTDHGYVSLEEDVASGDLREFAYDELGNLMQAVLHNADVIDYVNDARDRRVGKKVNGALVQGFVYHNQLVPAAELDELGDVVSRFVYGSKQHVPDYMVRNGATYRLIVDHHGSVVAVVDVDTGSVAQRIEYDSRGRVLVDTNPGFQPFGFAGGMWDSDTQLIRFGTRDYNPEIGRWMAKDTIGFLGNDANLFGYVLGDPVNYIDPSGREWRDPSTWNSGIVDGIAGFGDGLTTIPFTDSSSTNGIREMFDLNDVVNKDSCGYLVGDGSGQIYQVLLAAQWYRSGYELAYTKHYRLAPFGNRTGHPTGRWPHYHRRARKPNGDTKPGGSHKRHRPWDKKDTDTSFWDRF